LVLEDQEMPSNDYGDNVVSLVDALKKSLAKKSKPIADEEEETPAPKRRAAAERTKTPRAKAPAKAPAKKRAKK
ncbi:MAG: hypothetical protein NT015_19005, partial [Alphaproteobacteria bacterium]|nr:hypothetical protein [Alphaproteobacteria bacterium]